MKNEFTKKVMPILSCLSLMNPGVIDRLGFGYPAVSEREKRIPLAYLIR